MTIITVGSVAVEPIIRKALAIGADDAVRIDSEPADAFSTAKLIADYLGYAQGGQAIETGTINNLNTEANTDQTIAATPTYNEDGTPSNAAAEQEQADLNLTNANIESIKASTAKTVAETLGIEEQASADLGLTLAQMDKINKMTPLQVEEAQASIQSIRNANKLTKAELDALPAKARLERLTTLANIKGINLNNALVVAELKKAGWTSSEINRAKKGIESVNEGADS